MSKIGAKRHSTLTHSFTQLGAQSPCTRPYIGSVTGNYEGCQSQQRTTVSQTVIWWPLRWDVGAIRTLNKCLVKLIKIKTQQRQQSAAGRWGWAGANLQAQLLRSKRCIIRWLNNFIEIFFQFFFFYFVFLHLAPVGHCWHFGGIVWSPTPQPPPAEKRCFFRCVTRHASML